MSAGRSTKTEQCECFEITCGLFLFGVLLNFDFVIFAHVLSLKYAKSCLAGGLHTRNAASLRF